MARSVNNVNYVQMKIKIHGVFFFLFLSLIPTMVKGQTAEYNAATNWVYPTAQKVVGMDFINSSSGELVNNGIIIYKRNFTNNGTVKYVNTLAKDPALSEFSGSELQRISGTGTTRFYSLLLDSKLSNNAFSLEQNVSVANSVEFKKGVIMSLQTTPETAMNMLFVEAGATVVNASDNSYVDGFVSKTGGVAFTFPIGDGGYYRPASLSAVPSNTNSFAARYCLLNPETVGYTRTLKDPTIWRVSDKEYWVINRTNGTENPQLTLSWDVTKTSARIPTFLRDLSIVRWDGTKWIAEGNIMTTGDSKQGTITSNVTGYGIFALAMLTSALPIAKNDSAVTFEDNDTNVDVLDNDTCSNGGSIKFISFSIGGVTHMSGESVIIPNQGTVTASDKGIFTFKPDHNFTGTVSTISYSIGDIDDNLVTANLVIKVLPMPEVSKTSTKPFMNSDGSFNWVYTITIQNDTPNPLDSVQVEDNLDDVFLPKNCTYTITSIKASGGLVANGLFNGSNTIKTLLPNGTMLSNRTDTIEIEVKVDTHAQKDTVPVLNQALFTAKTILGSITSKTDADITTSELEATETKIPISEVLATEGFSPNGDGINDYYIISHDESTKIVLTIFNRTGYAIYESSDYMNNWDGKGTGKYAGQDIPDGTYFCSYKAVKISTGEVVSSAVKFITIHR